MSFLGRDNEVKPCSKCGTTKPASEFTKWSRRWCRACVRAYKSAYDKKRLIANPDIREAATIRSRTWALAHPERVRATGRRNKLKKKYGITPEQERAMRLAQENRCAFKTCEQPATDVDHIDLPGGPWVRGLLCHEHNVALGYLHDRAQDADDAADYLRADARRRVAVS